MTFVPNTGPVNTTQINNAFGLGEDLNNYRVKRWYYPGNLTTGFFSGATINISDFLANNQMILQQQVYILQILAVVLVFRYIVTQSL